MCHIDLLTYYVAINIINSNWSDKTVVHKVWLQCHIKLTIRLLFAKDKNDQFLSFQVRFWQDKYNTARLIYASTELWMDFSGLLIFILKTLKSS